MQVLIKQPWLASLLQLRIVRYGLTGGTATAIHLTVAWLYIYLLGESHYLSNFWGFSIAFIFSYLVQSKYVFKQARSWRNVLRFFLVQCSALLIAVVLTDFAYLFNAYIKVLLVVVLLPLITFTIHKLWTFAEH